MGIVRRDPGDRAMGKGKEGQKGQRKGLEKRKRHQTNYISSMKL